MRKHYDFSGARKNPYAAQLKKPVTLGPQTAGDQTAGDQDLADTLQLRLRRTNAAMDWKPYITADPAIMHGAVCFRGTRIPVSVVLDNLAAGETAESILDQYPTLLPEHIPAAVAYAADLVRERIVPLPA